WAFYIFFQAEDGIPELIVTGVQTCALPIWPRPSPMVLALLGVLVVGVLLSGILPGGKSSGINYTDFRKRVETGQVAKIDVYESSTSSKINGKGRDGKTFSTTGPSKLPDKDVQLFDDKGVA